MKRALVTADVLAEQLGIKTQTVYVWVRQKRLPFYRVGRLVKFDLDEVLAHFKVEAEREDDESAHNESKRSRRFVGRPIDPFRWRREPESSLTPEQRKRYEDMLKPK
jgi:excisionase family DNA binding protein